MNKTLKTILSLLLVLSIFNLLVLFNVFLSTKSLESLYEEAQSSQESLYEATQNTQEHFDESDRESAERHLWYLKGKIDEIHVLSFYLEIPDEVLQERLNDIVIYQNFECAKDSNHYIADFKFVIPDSSTVGELCNILSSQINDYILTI